MKRNVSKYLVSCLLIFGLTLSIPLEHAYAANLIKHGDRDGYVWDLQHRLQQLGYYTEALDGVFGSTTRQAVLNFQSKNNLTVDGIVGEKTWKKLHNQTYTQEEIEMLAKLVHGEARGESFEGKVAVAAVVFNRLKSPEFPNTVREVIFQPRAFTAIDDGQYFLTPDAESYKAVYLAIRGWDPTDGALFYFNPDTATSSWIWSRPQIKKIDQHIFAR